MPGAPQVPFDAEALPADALVVRLPPSGRVLVSMPPSLSGSPLATVVAVMIHPRTGAFALQRLRTPVTVFAHVPLGQIWLVGIPSFADPIEIDGPVHADDDVLVELRGRAMTTFTGTLLHAGKPAAAWQGHLDLGAGFATDDAGRFHSVKETDDLAADCTTITLHSRRDDGSRWHAVWRGTLAAGIDRHELGELVLQPEPEPQLLVAGRIVAAAGLDDLRLWIDGARASEVQWRVRTDGHFTGHFTGHGTAPVNPQLRVHSPHHLGAAPIPFAPGQTDLVVTLPPAVRVVLPVRVTAREQSLVHRARLRRLDQDANVTPTSQARSTEAGAVPRGPKTADGQRRWSARDGLTFTWPALAPGRYELSLQHPCREEPWRRWTVEIATTGGELRLAPIEAPALQVVRLRLPRPPIDFYDLEQPRIVGTDPSQGPISTIAEGDDAVLLVSTGPVDVRITKHGFRAHELRAVAADAEVSMAPGIPVELVFTGLPTNSQGTWSCSLSAIAEPELQCLQAFRGDRARFLLPAPGRYRLRLEEPQADDAEAMQLAPDVIDVTEQGGTFAVHARPR